MDYVIFLFIGILAVLLVLPCLIVSGRSSKNEEICKQCIYAEFAKDNSPCCICANSDRFERNVDDGR